MSDLPIYQGQVFGIDGGNAYGGGSGLSNFIFTNYGKFVGTVSTPTTTPTLQIDLLDSGATAGTYGSASVIPIITLDAKGIVSAVTTISSAAGTASGTVTSTSVTNTGTITGTVSTATSTPTIKLDLTDIGTAGTYGSSTQIPVITLDAKGRTTSITTVSGAGSGGSGTVTSVSVTDTGTITGTVSTATSTPTIKLDLTATGVSAGTYGASSQIPVITTDIYGRVSSITTVSGAGGGGGSGTVTSVSVTNNGNITGTVSTATSTPAVAVDLTNTGVTAGTYGNSRTMLIPTIDAKGRITSITTDAGNFITRINSSVAGTIPVIVGYSTSSGGVADFLFSTVSTPTDNFVYASSATAGGVKSPSFRALVNADLPASGVTAGTYGSASVIPVVTVNTRGVATSITTVSASGGGGSGAATTVSVNQTGHGFAAGDIVRLSGSNTYTKAQADSAANAEMAGMVSAVADVNNFTLTTQGQVTGLTGLTAAQVYFLDPTTAGTMTVTAPSTAGQIRKPVFYAQTTTTGIIYNLLGIVVANSAPPSGTVTSFAFTNANGFTGTVSTATTTPTLVLQRTFNSEVRVTGGNGHGSTNNKIRRFTTTVKNVGSDITYADSAALGATFTINTAGIYAIVYNDGANLGNSIGGLSKNSSQLTTSIQNITDSDILAVTHSHNGVPTNNYVGETTCYIGNLVAGDIIRAHTDAGGNPTSNIQVWINIARIG